MVIYRTIISWALAVGMLATSLNLSAAEEIGGRRIVDIGCHNSDGICFVTLDGAAFGASLNCKVGATNQFRFDNGDTAVGKRTFASMMAAYLAGKHVSIYLDGCSVQGFPVVQYFHVWD